MPERNKLTKEKKKEICKALEKALPFNYSCDLAGIARNTAYDHLNEKHASYDPEFRAQVAIAKAAAIKGLVALTGKQNGAWKLLKNLAKDEFTDVNKNIHVGEEDSAPIKMVIEDYRSKKEEE